MSASPSGEIVAAVTQGTAAAFLVTNSLLEALLKAGGTSALAIGAAYAFYVAIVNAKVIPKLQQKQGFYLLCLLAILIFLLALRVLWPQQARKPEPLPPAKVSISPPFKIDIRPEKHPKDAPGTWHTAPAFLTHDIVLRNAAEPARSAYVSRIEATLYIDGARYPYTWRHFVNMHEEIKDKWLGILGDATPFSIKEGESEAKEVLHQSNPDYRYHDLLKKLGSSVGSTARVSVVATVDDKPMETTCSLDMAHWRGVLAKLMPPDGSRLPPQVTMCCIEHPNTKGDDDCGSTNSNVGPK